MPRVVEEELALREYIGYKKRTIRRYRDLEEARPEPWGPSRGLVA
jgi:hypothetical protein